MTLKDIVTDILNKVIRLYQWGWLRDLDEHSFCAILGGRQIGKDFALAFYALCKAILEPGSEWNTFSASEKHAKQWLDEMGDPYRRTGSDLDGRVGIEWGVYGVPETFIVDGEGRIRYKHIGYLSLKVLDETVRPILEELTE